MPFSSYKWVNKICFIFVGYGVYNALRSFLVSWENNRLLIQNLFSFLGWIDCAVQSEGSAADEEYFVKTGVEHFVFLYRYSL
jgi:hypothetical protein